MTAVVMSTSNTRGENSQTMPVTSSMAGMSIESWREIARLRMTSVILESMSVIVLPYLPETWGA